MLSLRSKVVIYQGRDLSILSSGSWLSILLEGIRFSALNRIILEVIFWISALIPWKYHIILTETLHSIRLSFSGSWPHLIIQIIFTFWASLEKILIISGRIHIELFLSRSNLLYNCIPILFWVFYIFHDLDSEIFYPCFKFINAIISRNLHW